MLFRIGVRARARARANAGQNGYNYVLCPCVFFMFSQNRLQPLHIKATAHSKKKKIMSPYPAPTHCFSHCYHLTRYHCYPQWLFLFFPFSFFVPTFSFFSVVRRFSGVASCVPTSSISNHRPLPPSNRFNSPCLNSRYTFIVFYWCNG